MRWIYIAKDHALSYLVLNTRKRATLMKPAFASCSPLRPLPLVNVDIATKGVLDLQCRFTHLQQGEGIQEMMANGFRLTDLQQPARFLIGEENALARMN